MDWLDILDDPKEKKQSSNEKKSSDNDDDKYQAPFELMSEFLLLITQNKMIEALQKCDEILKFEPNNEMIKEYKKALGVYIEEILPEEEIEEEEEDDDDDDDDNDDDNTNDTNDDDDKNSDRSYNDSDDKNIDPNIDLSELKTSDEAKSDTKLDNMPKYHETKTRLDNERSNK